MRKPSVLLINRVYPPERGATGRLLRDLARAFVRDGWDVTVISGGAKSGKERDGAIRIARLRSTQKNMFAYAWLWLRILYKGLSLQRRDLVITLTDPPMLVAAGHLVARSKKSRHIHWCHDVYPDLLPVLGVKLPSKIMGLLSRISQNCLKSCDKIVVIGRCMAGKLMENGVPAGRITVIPNWPNEELFATGRLNKQRLAGPEALKQAKRRRKFQAKGSKPFEQLLRDTEPKFRVLYSGNLGLAHPVETILDAASLLAQTNPEIEFFFVGDGQQFDWLAGERDRRELDNIRFLPWQPASRLRTLMESGDLHLVSLKQDASGLVVPCKLYSALAVGRPSILIGPEESETAQIIRDFGAGSVVPQGEGLRLADTIRAYRLDSEMWFQAHEGAVKAGRVFIPDQSISVWLNRARAIAGVSEDQPRARPHRKKKAA